VQNDARDRKTPSKLRGFWHIGCLKNWVLKTLNLILILFLGTFVHSVSASQGSPQKPAEKYDDLPQRNLLLLSAGLGGGNMINANASIKLKTRQNYIIGAGILCASELNIQKSDRFDQNFISYNFLVGIARTGRFMQFQANTGLGLVRYTANGKKIGTSTYGSSPYGSCLNFCTTVPEYNIYEKKEGHTLGIPFEIIAILSSPYINPLFVGLGIGLNGNLNPEVSYIGMTLNFSLGAHW